MIATTPAFQTANAVLDLKPIFVFTIDGYARVFVRMPTDGDGASLGTLEAGERAWIQSIGDLNIQVDDMDGSAALGELSVTIQDFEGAITADMPTALFEGKAATLTVGYPGMSRSDFALLFTGIVDTVDSENDNNSYTFNCFDVSQVLSKPIFTTGDDGQPISSDHPRTLNGHPLDILLEILRTEIGLADTFIDVTKIETYRDGLYSGMQFVFSLDSSPTAADFISQQIMQPLAGYYWVNNKGQISVNFFDAGGAFATAMSLGLSQILDVPLAATADLINVIAWRFDKDSNGNYLSRPTEEYGASISRFGSVGDGQLYGQQIIQSDGMRAGFQGFFMAAYVSRFIFLRYGLKNLQYESVPFRWTACILEPGDIVEVSHPHVPDRQAGVIGITNRFMEVMDRTWNFEDGTVTLKLLDASYLVKLGKFLITGNSEAAYASASSTDKAKYMFLCNDSDLYSNGDPANPLG